MNERHGFITEKTHDKHDVVLPLPSTFLSSLYRLYIVLSNKGMKCIKINQSSKIYIQKNLYIKIIKYIKINIDKMKKYINKKIKYAKVKNKYIPENIHI